MQAPLNPSPLAEEKIVATVVSFYQSQQDYGSVTFDEENLTTLNTVAISEKSYAEILFTTFISDYVGVDFIKDPTALSSCKKALVYFEKNNFHFNAARCASGIGFYYSDEIGQPENADKFYFIAYENYSAADMTSAASLALSEYAKTTTNTTTATRILKDHLWTALLQNNNLKIEVELRYLATKLDGYDGKQALVYGVLSALPKMNLHPSQTLPTSEKIENCKDLLEEEIKVYGRPFCVFDKRDLKIIAKLIGKLTPVYQAEFADVLNRIIPKVFFVPSLKELLFDFLIRTQQLTHHTDQLAIVPKAQFSIYQQQYHKILSESHKRKPTPQGHTEQRDEKKSKAEAKI